MNLPTAYNIYVDRETGWVCTALEGTDESDIWVQVSELRLFIEQLLALPCDDIVVILASFLADIDAKRDPT